MKKLFGTTAIAAIIAGGILAMPSVAQAGHATMTHPSGKKVTIQCRNSGCTAWIYNKQGKLVATKRTPGGRSNYMKLYAKYKKQGYRKQGF